MAILHSAPLTAIPEYFTVTSAAAPDTYRESGFIPSPGRVYFGTAPDGAQCLVTTVAEGDPLDQVGAYRSEVAAPQVLANTGYWITWESFLPVDFPYNAVPDFFNQGTYCIAQMHDSPDVGNPIVNLSNVVFFVNNAGRIIVKVPTVGSFADKTIESNYDVYIGPELKLGQWVKMAWLVKFTTDSTGFVESYYDGVPVCKVWRQRTDYTNLLAPYLRLGVYDFHHLAGFGRMTQYIRNVVIRDISDSAFLALGMDRIAAAPKQIP